MKFAIPDEYITDVSIRIVHDPFKGRDSLTGEELITVLNGYHVATVYSSKDHDEFTKLRNQLEELGYIKTVRNSWNGDTVLKPFYLNGWLFKKGHRFPCASALKVSIQCARKYGWNNISSL